MVNQPIDVELVFTEFIRTFRKGRPLIEFCGKIGPGIPNADYYFPDDDVIVELKTLEVDAFRPKVIEERIMSAFKNEGYELSDYVNWLFRLKNFPKEVERRLLGTISRPIVECVKKAGKQISCSRELLRVPDAKGLILVANNGNFSFDPIQIGGIIGRAFEMLKDPRNCACVYFTPNVYHELGDGVSYELWLPVDNSGGDDLQEFIDKLGAAWFDYQEKIDRGVQVRKAGDDLQALVNSKVIRPADWPGESS